MNVSIVIPNYNGEELLRNNLPKVLAVAQYYREKNGEEIEIIVVDDCSTDNSTESIKSIKGIRNINSFKLIVNEKNLGFSSTVNRGVKEAGGDVVILLNTDVAPDKDFLEPLLEHFANPKVFAVGCMDKSIRGGKVILRGRGTGKWERGFLVHARGEINKSNTLWVNGGSGAFRKSIWQKLGGLDELYDPFYYEDIDLSYRAIKSGYVNLFEPRSVVVHEHEKGAIKTFYTPLQVKTIAYRNQFIFAWKNATDIRLQLMHGLWLPYHCLKALLDIELAFFSGLFLALFLLPKIIQSSFKVQKLFVKSDKEVTVPFSE